MEYLFIPKFLQSNVVDVILKIASARNEKVSEVGGLVNLNKKIRKDTFFSNQENEIFDNHIFHALHPRVKEHFKIDLSYREGYKVGTYYGEDGGFYIPHTDTQGGMNYRNISCVICLSKKEDYEGGIFQFVDLEKEFKFDKGDAVIFDSNLLHGVKPVTSGKRQIIATFMWNEENKSLCKNFYPFYIPCSMKITKTFRINRIEVMQQMLKEDGWKEAEENESVDFSYWDTLGNDYIPQATISVYPRNITNVFDDKRSLYQMFKRNELTSFLPRTYIDLKNIDDSVFERGKLLFLKKPCAAANLGVYVIKTRQEMDEIVKSQHQCYILQEEVENMYLHEGKKCVIRAYGLITEQNNYLYKDAKCNVYKKAYSDENTDNSIHNDEMPRSVDAVPLSTMPYQKEVNEKMKNICKHFNLFFENKWSKNRFIIIGYDFILNRNKDPILIEANAYPSLFTIPKLFNNIKFFQDIINIVIHKTGDTGGFEKCI